CSVLAFSRRTNDQIQSRQHGQLPSYPFQGRKQDGSPFSLETRKAIPLRGRRVGVGPGNLTKTKLNTLFCHCEVSSFSIDAKTFLMSCLTIPSSKRRKRTPNRSSRACLSRSLEAIWQWLSPEEVNNEPIERFLPIKIIAKHFLSPE